MPRDGFGIYTLPHEEVTPDTTIESAVYNSFTADVAQDLNAARPIIAGGTGADTAEEARANIGAEVAAQPVTNFDSHVWQTGSWQAADTATGGPAAVRLFGFANVLDANWAVVWAHYQGDGTPANPPRNWVREKRAGVWDPWQETVGSSIPVPISQGGTGATTAAAALTALGAVAKAGDTMTGDLALVYANPTMAMRKDDGGIAQTFIQNAAGLSRWLWRWSEPDAESGGDAGSSFSLYPCNDAGEVQAAALQGGRATGLLSVKGDPTAALGIATKQYVDSAVGGISVVSTPMCQGRIKVGSATEIRLDRYAGYRMWIGSQFESIPEAGITLSNGGLAANTAYNVYVYMNAGTMTLLCDAGAPVMGSFGIRRHNANGGLTYLGKVRTNASAQFQDTPPFRGIANEYNKLPIVGYSALAAGRTTSAPAWIELNSSDRIQYVLAEAQQVLLNVWATVSNTVQGSTFVATGVDGASHATAYGTASTPFINLAAAAGLAVTEGYHYGAFLAGSSSGGTAGYEASYSGHSVMFMG